MPARTFKIAVPGSERICPDQIDCDECGQLDFIAQAGGTFA